MSGRGTPCARSLHVTRTGPTNIIPGLLHICATLGVFNLCQPGSETAYRSGFHLRFPDYHLKLRMVLFVGLAGLFSLEDHLSPRCTNSPCKEPIFVTHEDCPH